MNVSSCPGCGDTHLCAGSPTTRVPADVGPGLADQVRRYVAATFTTDVTGVVGTNEAYTAYLNWCTAHEAVAFSRKRFVAAMGTLPQIRRVKRSTMRFTGITWKPATHRGRHAAPEAEFAGARR